MKRKHRKWLSARAVVVLVTLALTLWLSACAVKKPPSTSESIRKSLPPTTKIPEQWKSAGTNPAAVPADWLKTFGDPQMEAIVNEALQNNLYLQAAATRIDVAASTVTEVRSQLMPMVAVTGAATYLGRYDEKNLKGQNKGRYNASSLLGGVAWELDLWGRIRAQVAAANQALTATEADVQSARESLAAVTAKAWYMAVYTRMLQTYAEQNLRLKQQSLELAKAKFEVGEAQEQQAAMASADVSNAQSQLAQIRSAYEQVIRGLELLLGRYPSAELQAAITMVPCPPPVPAGLPVQLLERRPDVIAAEHKFDAAFHMVQSTKAARLPSINLTGAAGYMTNEIYQKLALRPWVWTVGANLAAPLYTGGFLRAQVKIANENQKAALLIYGQTALQAFGEVEVALTNERFLRDQQQDYDSVLKNITRALELEKTKYEVGQVDLGPVLSLQGAELGARMATAEVQYELLANRINLHLALGGGF
jgi:outer membrane protein, multidrug efflux system